MDNATGNSGVDEITTTVMESPVDAPRGNGLVMKLMMGVKMFFCVVIVINNIIILSSLRRWKSLSKTSTLLIAHLAYADLLSGIGIIIRTITTTVYGLSRYTCIIPMGLSAMSGGSSVTGVLFLSMEAFFCARSNNIYLSRKIYHRAAFGVATSWIFHLLFVLAGILTSVPTPGVRVCYFANPFYLKAYLTAFSAMIILHIPCVVGLQTVTYKNITSRLCQVLGSNVLSSNSSANMASSNGEPTSTGTLTPAVTAKRLMVVKKLTIMSILCGLIYVISWGPYALVLFLYSTAPSNRPDVITASHLINTGTVTTINSVANIYIYFARSKEFRRAVKEAFGCYSVVQDSS